ncbi:Bet1-like protein [Hibiscus syriacus]|uniref:Bet1-like protein n=1 Tax=Hibiscus syriacus TaxID=106335 RepID=A0A6A3CL40_HIBSY|nr:bet1-like protein At4g14600 [Hibiscus syriacus]KAE8728302.1 Bet1-like protein [Hibiscus syriacus]
MAFTSNRTGGDSFYGGATPYRSREGLSTRPAASSDEIQLRIDPMHGDLDDEISGLRSQVKQLRNVAQEIGSEAKFQKDFLDQLQMTMIKAQAGVKNNIRKLNKSIIKHGSNHIIHVVLFALFCFFVVYIWSKLSRR